MASTYEHSMELLILGGQLKACHDIFEILQADDLTDAERTMKLAKYQSDLSEQFKRRKAMYELSQKRNKERR